MANTNQGQDQHAPQHTKIKILKQIGILKCTEPTERKIYYLFLKNNKCLVVTKQNMNTILYTRESNATSDILCQADCKKCK